MKKFFPKTRQELKDFFDANEHILWYAWERDAQTRYIEYIKNKHNEHNIDISMSDLKQHIYSDKYDDKYKASNHYIEDYVEFEAGCVEYFWSISYDHKLDQLVQSLNIKKPSCIETVRDRNQHRSILESKWYKYNKTTATDATRIKEVRYVIGLDYTKNIKLWVSSRDAVNAIIKNAWYNLVIPYVSAYSPIPKDDEYDPVQFKFYKNWYFEIKIPEISKMIYDLILSRYIWAIFMVKWK
jgi:hypothetical protein